MRVLHMTPYLQLTDLIQLQTVQSVPKYYEYNKLRFVALTIGKINQFIISVSIPISTWVVNEIMYRDNGKGRRVSNVAVINI